MSMHEGIGCKGGTSALAGKVAAVYEIELPDGRKVRKSTFKVSAPKAVATGFEGRDGKACVVVRQGLLPVWDGEFGRLVAKRVK
jgi:hypothetical protein